ncbi:MAG: hypothetical protein FJ267_19070, partial [Planctomycetes bacterium]|nr:hypothetical protein [Planctomycetota bacterium]
MPAILVATSSFAEELKPDQLQVGPALEKHSAADIENAYRGGSLPEGIRMFLSIQKGERLGAGQGWFG